MQQRNHELFALHMSVYSHYRNCLQNQFFHILDNFLSELNPIQELEDDLNRTIEAMTEQAIKAVEEDHSDVMILTIIIFEY